MLEDKNEGAPPLFDDQPISEPQMSCTVSGELDPGPDDVIVSADDTGLVTVTYSQPDCDSGTRIGTRVVCGYSNYKERLFSFSFVSCLSFLVGMHACFFVNLVSA